MSEIQLTSAYTNWRQEAEKLQALLQELGNQLIDAETELAERLAAIGAFEFKLRAHIGHLTEKLNRSEAEIQQLRQKLRRMGDNWFEAGFERDTATWSMGEGAAAEGEYRYWKNAPKTPLHPQLNAEQAQELKKLYRQLARRFHPDMALDDADREYRTHMMMAINAAYAAGDREKLAQLWLEPDGAQRLEYAQTEQQLAEALQREVERVQRRLAEIKQDLARLARHQSSKWMRQAEQATARGRDFFADMAVQLRERIARKMVERDVLQGELESLELDETAVSEDFADLVWNVSLEQSLDADPLPEYDPYIRRRRSWGDDDDDILDDTE